MRVVRACLLLLATALAFRTLLAHSKVPFSVRRRMAGTFPGQLRGLFMVQTVILSTEWIWGTAIQDSVVRRRSHSDSQ